MWEKLSNQQRVCVAAGVVCLMFGAAYASGYFDKANQNVPVVLGNNPDAKNTETNSEEEIQEQSRKVTKVDLGEKWPLTVDSGTVRYQPISPGLGIATFIAPDGTEYALNGIAGSRGYPQIRPIWRDNPKIPGAKINIEPLRELITKK